MTATLTKTKSRPILFTDAMVKAILAGRKTQTRRIVTADRSWLRYYSGDKKAAYEAFHRDASRPWRCWLGGLKPIPEGGPTHHWQEGDEKLPQNYQPGDELWVREGVIQTGHERTGRNGQYLWPKLEEDEGREWFDAHCHYTADLKRDDPAYVEPHGRLNKMFMPRWASRIILRLTEVRPQRLQDITEEDARAEGVFAGWPAWDNNEANSTFEARVTFREHWERINGAASWKLNPWVWALTFERI